MHTYTYIYIHQFSSVAQSCLTLIYKDTDRPIFPHYLSEVLCIFKYNSPMLFVTLYRKLFINSYNYIDHLKLLYLHNKICIVRQRKRLKKMIYKYVN